MSSEVALKRQEAALVRLQSDSLIKQMIVDEPVVLALLQIAARQTSGRDRWHAYEVLKCVSDPYVGWCARNKAVSSERHYDALIKAIDELLPSWHEGRDEDELADDEDLVSKWQSDIENRGEL